MLFVIITFWGDLKQAHIIDVINYDCDPVLWDYKTKTDDWPIVICRVLDGWYTWGRAMNNGTPGWGVNELLYLWLGSHSIISLIYLTPSPPITNGTSNTLKCTPWLASNTNPCGTLYPYFPTTFNLFFADTLVTWIIWSNSACNDNSVWPQLLVPLSS